MSTRRAPGGDGATSPARLDVFEGERAHLRSLAFRILGSESDAEDVVQEAWIRYDRADVGDIHNAAAWLTTVTTRLCLDCLRRRREVPQDPTELVDEPAAPSDGPGPEELALLSTDLTSAFAVVLEELTPPQRVALVLHDGFGVPFEEVAHVLDTTTASAKKLASRARQRVRHQPGATSGPAERTHDVVAAFLRAASDGDTDQLVALLDPDVVRTADPQVLAPASAQRVRGAKAVVAETRAFQANAQRARLASINGRPGIVVTAGTAVRAALLFHVAGDRIVHYDVVADPKRLALLHVHY